MTGLAFATGLALLVAAAALAGYGGHAAWVTLAIVAPLGWLTVIATERLIAHRARLGGLPRQFAAVGLVSATMLAAAVAAFVALMFVSRHDAFFTVLLAVYAGALAVWASVRIGRLALRDLDEARSREERVRQTLFAAVSHDLRTPVTALRLLANAIDDEVVDADTRREYVARMGTHVRALGTLIDDLFELTRLQSGELEWTMERVSVELLLAEAVDAMRPAAEAGAVSVNARLDPALGAARANPEQLQRVLFNLIQNAIHHTPADGSVTVSAEAVGDAIEVEVADTGNGVPAEQRDRVFDPFFRGDAARQDGGAGLGLAISRAIVEAHGGRIWIADASDGTSVRFRLPAATQ